LTPALMICGKAPIKDALPQLLSAGIQLIQALINGVLSLLGTLLSAAGTLISQIFYLIGCIGNPIFDIFN
jgi:phage-related protein